MGSSATTSTRRTNDNESESGPRHPSEADLASLGLTVTQYLRLPIDTREAILVAVGNADTQASPTGEFVRRPLSERSTASSATSVVRSASSTATSARTPERSPAYSRISTRERP